MPILLIIPLAMGLFAASVKSVVIVGLAVLVAAFATTLPVLSRVRHVEGMAIAVGRAAGSFAMVGTVYMAAALTIYAIGLGVGGFFR
jgi:hypothetical protein